MTNHFSGLLSYWYARPLSRQAAECLKSRAEIIVHTRQGSKPTRLARIDHMCARYWLEEFDEFDFKLLSQNLSQNQRIQALLHLAYGQLLIARKLAGAYKYLDKGLRLADGIIRVQEYFALYNRHETLRSLRLTNKPVDGLELQQLLNEAGVIDKITQKHDAGMTFIPARFDTLMSKSWN